MGWVCWGGCRPPRPPGGWGAPPPRPPGGFRRLRRRCNARAPRAACARPAGRPAGQTNPDSPTYDGSQASNAYSHMFLYEQTDLLGPRILDMTGHTFRIRHTHTHHRALPLLFPLPLPLLLCVSHCSSHSAALCLPLLFQLQLPLLHPQLPSLLLCVPHYSFNSFPTAPPTAPPTAALCLPLLLQLLLHRTAL